MRWPWRRSRSEHVKQATELAKASQHEAAAAAQRAEQQLAELTEQRAVVDRTAAAHRQLRRENHFGDVIRARMRGRPA